MSADLYARLRQLKDSQQRAGVATQRSDASGAAKAGEGERVLDLEGWREEAPLVFARSTAVDLPHGFGDKVMTGSLVLSRALEGVKQDRIGFYDTETTGLSGGAGSHIFLFGLGRIEKDLFVVRQLFLGDYPAEPEFLASVTSLLSEVDILVSYNGRAFDSHLLATRYLMNRLPHQRKPEADLLYPSRSLFRRIIGGCALSDIEREVLNSKRELDVAGALIPALYFEFLRTRGTADLEPVFAHHLEDIVSLFKLLIRIEGHLAEDGPIDGIDRFEAARLLCRYEQTDRAMRLLERISREQMNLREARLLGDMYRRIGAHSKCEELWREQYEATHSPTIGIALAKLYEHQKRSYAEALALVRHMVSLPHAGPLRSELRHRLARLERRVKSAD